MHQRFEFETLEAHLEGNSQGPIKNLDPMEGKYSFPSQLISIFFFVFVNFIVCIFVKINLIKKIELNQTMIY